MQRRGRRLWRCGGCCALFRPSVVVEGLVGGSFYSLSSKKTISELQYCHRREERCSRFEFFVWKNGGRYVEWSSSCRRLQIVVSQNVSVLNVTVLIVGVSILTKNIFTIRNYSGQA